MSEQGFTQHSGIAAPLDQANVDTDQIIPKQFLTGVTRAGYGKHLFHDWRYLDLEEKEPNPEFSLNKPEHRVPVFCWHVKTSVVAQAESMRLGRWLTLALKRSSPPALQIFFTVTALTTNWCLWHYLAQKWINFLLP